MAPNSVVKPPRSTIQTSAVAQGDMTNDDAAQEAKMLGPIGRTSRLAPPSIESGVEIFMLSLQSKLCDRRCLASIELESAALLHL